MPPAVEFRHRLGSVGMQEIFRQVIAQHFSDAHGHQAITVEVKIQPHSISDQRQPCKRRGNAFVADYRSLSPKAAQTVGNGNLQAKAQNQKLQAVMDILIGRLCILCLQFQLHRIHQRAGQQLGEHDDLRCEGQHILFRQEFQPEHINQIGRNLEHVKAHASRQPAASVIDLKEDQNCRKYR